MAEVVNEVNQAVLLIQQQIQKYSNDLSRIANKIISLTHENDLLQAKVDSLKKALEVLPKEEI